MRKADGTDLSIRKCPLLHIHQIFTLEWTKQAYFQSTILENAMQG